jgi:hypothetical protein
VPFAVLDSQSAQPTTIARCFLACADNTDCGSDGRLTCDQTRQICVGGSFLSNLGSDGAHKMDGSACVAPAIDPTAGPRLGTGPNVKVNDVRESAPNETALAVDPRSGKIYVGFNAGALPLASSTDGRSWMSEGNLDPGYAGDPQLAIDDNGRVYFSFISIAQPLMCAVNATYPGGDEIHVVYSDDLGATYSSPSNVVPQNLRNDSFFADKPWITVGPGGAVYVSFSAFPTGNAAAPNDIVVTRSHDRGATWQAATANDSNRVHGRSLCMLTTDAQGALYAAWWEDSGDPSAPGGYIWTTTSQDGGVTFSPNRRVNPQPDAAFDDPAIVVTADGQVAYVVYDRVVPGAAMDAYDVVATASVAGADFRTPIKVNDDASCATHFHAAAAADAAGTLYVVWYDNRYGDARVMWSRTQRPTATSALAFLQNGQVTDTAFSFTTTRQQFFLGDYLAITIVNQRAYVAWTDLRNAGKSGASGPISSEIWLAQGALPP